MVISLNIDPLHLDLIGRNCLSSDWKDFVKVQPASKTLPENLLLFWAAHQNLT
jgi:hypothetical protein